MSPIASARSPPATGTIRRAATSPTTISAATIGGPIIRNRTFFFGDYLRIEDHSANNDRLTVPTAAATQWAISALRTTPIYDPTTGNPDTGAGRTQFPGNIIPGESHQPRLGQNSQRYSAAATSRA